LIASWLNKNNKEAHPHMGKVTADSVSQSLANNCLPNDASVPHFHCWR